jgi:hypothetical protein
MPAVKQHIDTNIWALSILDELAICLKDLKLSKEQYDKQFELGLRYLQQQKIVIKTPYYNAWAQ